MFSRIPESGRRWVAVFAGAAVFGGCGSAPRYDQFAPEDLWDIAQGSFDSGNFGDAAEEFERVVLLNPTWERVPEARLMMAKSFFEDGKNVSATSEYARILDRYPNHPVAGEASLGLCQAYVELSPKIQRDQEYTLLALSSCQNVARDYFGTDVGIRAAEEANAMLEKLAEKDYERGEYYYKLGIYDSARHYYEDVPVQYPGTAGSAKSMYRLYMIYKGWRYDEEVAIWRDRILREFPESEQAELVRLEEAADTTATSGGGR